MKPSLKKLYDANIDDFGNLEPDQILGLTIYAEARGEIRAGRIAVGTVILERVDHRGWDGDNIIDVCLWPFQFSCYLKYDPQRIALVRIATDFLSYYRNSAPLMECANIAWGLIKGTIPRDPELAVAHCCQYMNPETAEPGQEEKLLKAGMKIVKEVGAHRFYEEGRG